MSHGYNTDDALPILKLIVGRTGEIQSIEKIISLNTERDEQLINDLSTFVGFQNIAISTKDRSPVYTSPRSALKADAELKKYSAKHNDMMSFWVSDFYASLAQSWISLSPPKYGKATAKIVVARNGQVLDSYIAESSCDPEFDKLALRAINKTLFKPFPEKFDRLVVIGSYVFDGQQYAIMDSSWQRNGVKTFPIRSRLSH